MKKKLTLIVSAVALGALLAVGGTLAWFTDTETATNVVTMGNVNVALHENGEEVVVDANQKGLGIQFGKETPVTPGANLDKDVTVKNIGANAAYIRAKVEIDGMQAGNDPLVLVGLEGNTNWTKNGDYYYYNAILAKDATTPSLFTDAEIPSTWGNNAAGKGLNIIVTVEAMQSDNVPVGEAVTGADAAIAAFAAPATPAA